MKSQDTEIKALRDITADYWSSLTSLNCQFLWHVLCAGVKDIKCTTLFCYNIAIYKGLQNDASIAIQYIAIHYKMMPVFPEVDQATYVVAQCTTSPAFFPSQFEQTAKQANL